MIFLRLSLLILLGLSGNVYAQEASQETIEVSVVEPLNERDPIGSKKNIQDQALVKALLKASQTICNPRIFEQNNVLLSAAFLENITSFINDYQYLEQKVEQNQYHLQLKVIPKWYYLKNKLTDWGCIGFASKPDLVIQPILINPEAKNVTQSAEFWTQKITQQLASLGMNTSSRSMDAIVIESKIQKTTAKSIEIAFSFWDQKNQTRYERIYQNILHRDESLVAGFASLYLLETIMPIWFETQGSQSIFEVKFQTPANYKVLLDFIATLEAQKGIVQSVREKVLKQGAVILEVGLLSDQIHFFDFLSNLDVQGQRVRVIEQNGKSFTVEIPQV